MNVLWELFEISVNFFQGFIMMYFAYSYLGDKNDKRFFQSSGVLFGILLAVLISIFNYYMVFENYYSIFYILVIFTYCLISLKGKVIRKIFASVLPMVLSLVSSALVSNFAAWLFGTDLYNIISENNTDRFITVISVQLMIIYLVIITLRLLNKKDEHKHSLVMTEWLLISSVFVISIIIGVFLNIISLYDISYENRRYLVFSMAGILLINVVVCFLVIDLGKKNNAITENELLRMQNEYNKQYVDNADREYELIKKIRHDHKNNYQTLYTLISEGKNEAAIEHIKDNLEQIVKTETFIRTNNDFVNAVINSKLTTARSYGIEATCISVNDFSGIEDGDLCRMLSNMLENAITACTKNKRQDNQLYLKITSDEYKYIFNLKNSIDESVLDKNPKLFTTKKNKNEHGYGTKIIRDVAKKYHGRCDFYEEEGFFCCMITINK